MNKDINYIIKRVIVGLLVGIILFSIKSCNVKALANTGIFSDLVIPGSEQEGRFYSNNSGTLSDRGYSLLSSNDIYYSLPSSANYFYGTYGGVLSICNLSFFTNNYYSVTYTFVSSGGDYVHPTFSSSTYKLGMMQNVLDTNLSFNYEGINSGWFYTTIPGLLPIGDEIYAYTAIFKATGPYTCLSSAFSSYSKTLTATELAFVGYKYESLGSQPLTQQEMANIINNSNQQVINNIQSSANSIINNQNSSTQSIINNQNQNTQDLIDSQKVCYLIDKANITLDNQVLSRTDGTSSSYSGYGVTNYISIDSSSVLTLTKKINSNVNASACFYNINKSFISCVIQNNLTEGEVIPIPAGSSYFRATIDKNLNQPQWKICRNGNQATTDSINDLNNTMNDSSTDSPNNGINAVKNGLASNGVITQLITLPVTLFQQVLTSINGTCQTFNLGSLFGTNLTLPCIDVSNYLGSSLWGIIDVIISGYFVWVIARKMISAFEMFSSMKDGDVLDD